MSSAVFPVLPGLAWDRRRSPQWSTLVQKAVSGRETRAALWQYPLYQWELTYEFLRADATHAELQTLVGFFNARRGAFESFLYEDPADNAATGQTLGLGDGATRDFPLARTQGGFTQPVDALKALGAVYLAGSPASSFSVSGTVITFDTAPGAGVAVTADFSFYWRVRFSEDTAEFSEFMRLLFEARTIILQGVRE